MAVGAARARIVLGAAMVLAPAVSARLLGGRDGAQGASRLLARMVGAREVGLGLGVVIALDRGAPVRGWLEACALADGADLAACLLARDRVPRGTLPGVLALAGGGALLHAWLARRLDPAPPPEPGHLEAVATGHPPERVAAAAREH